MPYELRVIDSNISRITLCEAVVVLDGKEFILRPTLRAMLVVLQNGGFEKVVEGLRSEDFDSIEIALKAGLNWKEKKNRKIGNLIWKTGINLDLIEILIDFIENLNRGGKLPMDEREVRITEEQASPFVTLEQWADKQFFFATGWLGWPPEVALNTNLGALRLAIEGKVDFVKKTNPFGSGEDEKQPDDLITAPANPSLAAKQFLDFAERKIRQAERERSRKKEKT